MLEARSKQRYEVIEITLPRLPDNQIMINRQLLESEKGVIMFWSWVKTSLARKVFVTIGRVPRQSTEAIGT